MKKVLSSIKAMLIIIITSYLSLGISEVKAEEIKNEIPSIYYNILLNEEEINEMVVYENDVYVASDKNLFKYDFEISQWLKTNAEVPVENLMGKLKVVQYNALKNQIIIKNNTKIMMDIYNDGKEVYELNVKYENEKEQYYWEKFIENGSIVKKLEKEIDEYKLVSIEENVKSESIKTENEEYYFKENNLYVRYNNKVQLIKEYAEVETSLLKIKKIKDNIYVYGDKFGIDLIEKRKVNGEYIYTTNSMGKIIDEEEEVSVTKLDSPDNGGSLFILGNNNNVYKIIIGDTWIEVKDEIKMEEKIEYLQEEIDVTIFENGDKIYEIVNDAENNKAYITVNGNIIESTIKVNYNYPDKIFRFEDDDSYIYFLGNECSPIRINTKNNNAEFMGENYIFNDFININKKIMRDIDNNIFIEKADGKVYKYVSKDKFYETKAPPTITAIEIMNDECYAINKEGLYKFNRNGDWQVIVEDNGIVKYPEELISVDNKLFTISEGSLYELSKNSTWDIVDGKINNDLTSIYYKDIKDKKIYFIAKENGLNKNVNIFDYGKKQWSRTKDLSGINGINSIAVDNGDIYIGTKYFSDGAVYIYKNFGWNSLKGQFLAETDAIKIYPMIDINNKIYIQIEDITKKQLNIFNVNSGKIEKAQFSTDEQNEIHNIYKEKSVYSTSNSIQFQLKNGIVLMKKKWY